MTDKTSLRRRAARAAFPLYITAATVFLALQMFQGLSFLDIGMYLAGCRWFNEDPWSCYYLGQWFLSYKLTGALLHACGDSSFMALRVMALALNIVTQTAIYLYTSRLVPRRYAIAGLAMATLACFGGYTDINYNDWSVALLTAALLCYHAGLFRRRGLWLIAAAGGLAGVAVFFRVVNLTFLVMPLVAAAVSRRCGSAVGAGRQLAAFALGAAAGCAAVIGAAVADGSAPVLLQTALDLTAIGGSADDPHSLKNVVISAYTVWKGYVAGFAPVALIALLMALAARAHGPWRRLPLMALLSGLAALNVYFWEPSANITAGTAIAALALAVGAGRRWGRAECLLVLSLMVPLVFPLGSNGGPQFFGQYVGFLPLPVALWVVARGLPATAGWHGPQWRTALGCAFAAVCAGLLLANARRPLMEDGTRAECRHTVCSPATRHIMTTGANARMYAYLQREAGARVPRGSYMMCNFSLPLISVLECRPYAVFSDVFTSERMNRAYIDTAYRRAGGGGRLPWLLLDRSTLTDGFADACRHLRRYAPYRLTWTDGRYELWKPLTGNREKRPVGKPCRGGLSEIGTRR